MEINDFKEKVLPLKSKLFRIAKRLLNSYEEAEDALQDVYLKLWERRTTVSEYNNLEAFAVTMIKNHCIDMLRKNRMKFISQNEIELENLSINPEKDYNNKEVFEQIRKIIDGFPLNQKLALQLRDIEGYEMEEIAEILQTNIGNVRVILSRARSEVRNILSKKMKYSYGNN